MEAFPRHDGVLGPGRAQLHLEILPEHVDSIEGADDGERELGKRLGTLDRSPQSPPPWYPRIQARTPSPF